MKEITNYLTKKLFNEGYFILAHSEYVFRAQKQNRRIIIQERRLKGLFFFELYNLEHEEEMVYCFPLPETLNGFMKVCSLLKIFHVHNEIDAH